MGASQKSDPSNICISDISETHEDPLARAVRKGLTLGAKPIYKGILCVFSTEKPRVAITRPISNDTAPLPGFRAGILPVLGPLPAIFGNCLATIVIESLAGWETDWVGSGSGDLKEWTRMHKKLASKELLRTGRYLIIDIFEPFALTSDFSSKIPTTPSELGYLLRDVWRKRSGISLEHSKLCFVVWDQQLPLSSQNIVVMTEEEAKEHDERSSNGESLQNIYSEPIIKRVKQRFEEEQHLRELYG